VSFLPSWPLENTTVTSLGLLLVLGAMGGYLTHHLRWLPSISGFMLTGFACGPGGLGLLSQDALLSSKFLIDIALGLILYRLGLSLDLRAIARTPKVILISLLESAATFGAAYAALAAFDIPAPLAITVSAIVISSSPAVLLHVAHEVSASGPVTETAKAMVALNNVIAFVAFSAALPLMHASGGAEWTTILFQPMYRSVGSLVLGTLLARALHGFSARTRHSPQYQLALTIGTVMFSIGIADALDLSMLFAPLVLGVAIKSLEKDNLVSGIPFGPTFELVFIVLFVSAGAKLHLRELIAHAPAIAGLVVARSLGKVVAASAGAFLGGASGAASVSGGLLLIPMAGLALGLVETSNRLFASEAPLIAAIVLGAVAVFEAIGPPIASYAFKLAGEAGNAAAPVGRPQTGVQIGP
jgi:Kef-type K+ transport system membrane component KefB